ncbi:MAG TPA: type II secretion system F family protein [Candidatus Limnocylindria bacterium]|jgi:Flp pilus assembly protein TadB
MTILIGVAGLALLAAALPLRPVAERLRAGRDRQSRRAALPALIDAIAAGLAAGLSLEQAFAEVASTLPAALARPTSAVATALRLGEPIDRALGAYDGVIAAAEIAPFAIVLSAFARSGGRIGRSLVRVARLLRGRLALDAERAALTAQGRLSAVVLVALAPLGAVFFAILTPSYAATLAGPGKGLALAGLGLEICGAVWLWRLVRAPSDVPELASLLDAVIVGLDAGLSFELSLAALVARSPRVARLPEARRLLADLRLGRPPRLAFEAFAASGPDEARIAALVESARRFGAPLAELLVAQADALREAERHRAEAKARRLPILMTFPLTFCVLPALLLVFLGPPLLSMLG